jgi:NADH-quinone oxidoreductase subunit E
MGREKPQAACIEVLKVVQARRGWISDETLREVAEHIEITPDELDDVATFYNMIFRKPVGRHVIHLCDSVTCWIMGYEGLLEHLTAQLGVKLGGTTTDGRFTLLPNCCLGVCEKAPALIIDGEVHVDLSVEKLNGILDSYK